MHATTNIAYHNVPTYMVITGNIQTHEKHHHHLKQICNSDTKYFQLSVPRSPEAHVTASLRLGPDISQSYIHIEFDTMS